MTIEPKKPDKAAAKQWTAERLVGYSRTQVENLRENAVRFGSQAIVTLCDADLARRAPPKPRRYQPSADHSGSDFVSEYHFVCSADRGVTLLPDGQFRTGSWVVSEENVKRSLEHGAMVALHESRAALSYRQGRVVGYSVTVRNMLPDEMEKTETGIEFLVESSPEPIGWFGAATGEKGYRWTKIARTTNGDAKVGP